MSPSPSPNHQSVSKCLQRVLEAYFEEQLGYAVFKAPLDVILGSADVVQPDLIVVADRQQISTRGIEGAPLVLVDILSPSRPAYDRSTKAQRYAAHAVPHYWIVDQDARTLECVRLEGAIYHLDASAAASATPDIPGLMV